jgi:signal transduction histidine kinase
MSIKSKLIISYIILIVFSISCLGFFIADKSRDAIFNEVTEKSQRISELILNMVSVRNDLLSEKIRTDLHCAEQKLDNLGSIKIDAVNSVKVEDHSLPSLYAGSTNLTVNNDFVDNIEESLEAIASIFLLMDQKLVRVTTNLTVNNTRPIGSYIDNKSPIYKTIIKDQHYYGNSLVLGEWFVAGYKPLKDVDGRIIGAIALGYKALNNHLEKTINDVKIGETGYVYVMNSSGDVFVHPHIKGDNLGNYDFFKRIAAQKNGIIEYELEGVKKLAAYRYFEPWDWHIVTTANYDDLEAPSTSLLSTIIIITLIILLLSIILAIFLTHTFVMPINKLKGYMEIAGKGDLTIQSDINTKDEIGVLSNSFNSMIKENKRLLEETIKYDSLKTEFFSNISHELKTPINIIFSTTQLFSLYTDKDIEASIDSLKFKKHVNTIKQNCYRLLRLVNNLIDITKIDSGFMLLDLKNHNIVEVIENITMSTTEYIKSKSRTIIFDTDIEEKIMALDAEKIERIILNLISNGVKFTRPGDKIEVNVYDKGDNIQISVKDTGIGIPGDKLDMIFERFKQVDPLLSRRHEGSGIGLSLVKSLVEMHKGTIHVNSKCNKGTEFVIELPVRLIDNDNSEEHKNNINHHANVEKIEVEFSDIYE